MLRPLSIVVLAAGLAAAEDWQIPKRTNAGFGYWRAMALLQSPPAEDKVWTESISPVLAGTAEWNDAVLRPIVEKNRAALLEVDKASVKPECDFGIEYEDGFEAMMPHLAKMRALGKMNQLRVEMEFAFGRESDGIDAALAGLRMGAHMAQDRILISALVAKALMDASMESLARWVCNGTPTSEGLGRVAKGLGALPQWGFDWSLALEAESRIAMRMMDDYAKEDDAFEALAEELGMGEDANIEDGLKRAADELGIDVDEMKKPEVARKLILAWRDEYGKMMGNAAALLRGPAWEVGGKLEGLTEKISKSNLFAQLLMPSLSRFGEQRADLEAQRAGLLAAAAVRGNVLEKGTAPESLEGLGLPPDPHDGKTMVLENREGMVVVAMRGKAVGGKLREYAILVK